jgi:hypothetical protein
VIANKVRAGWEHRFPEITRPWTHWRLFGDGVRLADVPADDLLGALQVVEANFEKFKMIKAIRLRIDADGNVRPDKAEFEISRREYDARGKG